MYAAQHASSFFANSGFFWIFTTASFNRRTIGSGVPAGAKMPVYAAAWKLGMPASAINGTLGNVGSRTGEVVASTFMRPACACASTERMSWNMKVNCPLIRSVTACGLLL